MVGDIALTCDQACAHLDSLGGTDNAAIQEICHEYMGNRTTRKLLDYTRYFGRWPWLINYVSNHGECANTAANFKD